MLSAFGVTDGHVPEPIPAGDQRLQDPLPLLYPADGGRRATLYLDGNWLTCFVIASCVFSGIDWVCIRIPKFRGEQVPWRGVWLGCPHMRICAKGCMRSESISRIE